MTKTRKPVKDTTAVYRSGHWDEPNILAHIRLNDRTDADGKRVLFVEEVQSDWAQEGRKRGFAGEAPKSPIRWTILGRSGDGIGSGMGLTKEEAIADFRSAAGAAAGAAAVDARPGVSGIEQVPRAPFVDKTDAWLSLALKRVIRMAAEEGYDRVAFVNGQQSADRYDLSKQVSRVRFEDNHALGVGRADLTGPHTRGRLLAYDLGGRKVIDRDVQDAPKELPDLIGKELAAKLLNLPGKSQRTGGGNESRVKELSGLDLKVGGEGMIAFYDKIVPAALNKLLPRLGGDRVGEVAFPKLPDVKGSGWESTETPGPQTGAPRVQPGFDVTPAMRELAAKGMPLFARGANDAMPSGLTMQEARERIRQMRGATVGEVQSIVQQMTANWKGGPLVHVVDTYRDLPAQLNAPAGVRGVHSNGQVWIVASSHRRGANLREAVGSTLAHEAVAHYGLRKILGDDFDRMLTRPMRLAIASGNKPMRELRDFVRQAYRDADGTYNLTAHQEADEMAALAVEKAVDDNGNFRPGYSWLKSVWARVAQFLRDLGITVKFTNAELHGMLIYELQDGRVDLKRVQEAIRRSGQTNQERFDAALAETLYPGRVDRRTTTSSSARPGRCWKPWRAGVTLTELRTT
jgi:hypothetical protein